MFLKVGGQKNLLENYCNFNISCKETFSADRTVDGAAEEEEGAWVWSNGAAWRYPGYVWPWGSGEPDGLRGENCLFLMWSGGSDEHWIDHSCNHVGNTGFVCQVPTQKSNFWEILQIVSKMKMFCGR